MRFSRCQLLKPGRRKIKPGYGERRRKRELQKVPLFPALVKCAEEYQNRMQESLDSWLEMMRKSHADDWRKVRMILRSMCSGKREKFLNYWNHHSCPGAGVYALDILSRGFCIRYDR